MPGVGEPVSWSVEQAIYIRTRSERYPGATNIEPAWTQQVMDDPDLIAFEPDPKSRVGASRRRVPDRRHSAGGDRLPRP
jgi:hypothetical protein